MIRIYSIFHKSLHLAQNLVVNFRTISDVVDYRYCLLMLERMLNAMLQNF